MNIIYKWNDESTYTGGNPPRQYKKGDVVPLHIFPPNILKQHMMYNRIIKCEPRMIPDVTLSISVMAHPQRASFFQGLKDKLGDVPFAIDQNNNLIENCKAAWRLHDPGADFHVVIQDDAIVCNNFKERAVRFITARESERIAYGNPVQGYNFFYRGEYPPEKMREFEKQGCLYEGRNRGGVAICLPVNQIENMLEFFDTIDNRHDDERISQWIIKNKFRMCFPLPSFIDHNDHNPSIAGNRPNVIRQAWKFIDNEKKVIPKIIHQLWIGPKPPPLKWMQTWKEKNPGWLYKLWDINMINNHRWINQRHIDFYLKQGLWHGVKDVCQYEILYNEGGAFFDADTECLYPINELFTEEHDAYSYWENEEVRPGLIQPLIAAVKGSQFAKELIEGLREKPVGGVPWKTTGNQYVGEMYRKTSASVKIFPSGYFNPEHYTGEKYSGNEKIYSRHYFGSTVENTYEKGVSCMPVDKIIAAHPQTISTMVNIDSMRYILDNFYLVMDIPGDVVELACNIGTTALYVRRLLDMIESDKIYHVYDSFQGLPEPSEIDGDLCKKGDMKKEQTEFEQTFLDHRLECPIIHKGWFIDIPDNEYPDKICFAFFDGDFYSSILDSFCKVYHKMSKGGVIIVHDYEGAQLPGVKVACDYFLKDKPEKVCEVVRGMAKIVKE